MQGSASSRVCLDIHVYVYGCVQSKSYLWNNVKYLQYKKGIDIMWSVHNLGYVYHNIDREVVRLYLILGVLKLKALRSIAANMVSQGAY